MEGTDNRMSSHEFDQFNFLRARQASAGPPCPSGQEWERLADGEFAMEREAELIEHCASCDHCAREFHMAMALARPLEVWEEQLIESLPSSNAAGQARLCAGAGGRRIFAVRWLAAAAAVALATALWYYPGWQRGRIDREIAQEYAQNRPVEFRLDGLPYGQYLERRSPVGPRVVDLAHIPPKSPAAWRAAILEGDLSSAIAQLQDALRREPRSPSVLSDLAATYAARGDRLRSPADYEAAVSLLDQALAIAPDHHAALFNRLLLASRLQRRELIRPAAERVLSTEPDPGWRAEAGTFLDGR